MGLKAAFIDLFIKPLYIEIKLYNFIGLLQMIPKEHTPLTSYYIIKGHYNTIKKIRLTH